MREDRKLDDIQERYRALMEHSFYCIYLYDLEGRFLDANDAALKLLGYDRSEICSLNLASLLNEDELQIALEDTRHILETGGLRKPRVYRLRKKEGGEVRVEVDASLITRNGAPYAIQGVGKDITDQYQTEAALKEREAQYRAMVDAFDGLIYVCSQDYRVEFMNHRLVERTGRDATGELCYKALHDLDHICPWCVNDRVFKGESVRWEVKSPKDDRWYYIVNTAIYHENGAISKQAMILDITEHKMMEEELKAYSEKMKFFAYSVSHDLKNPAVSTHGFAQRLMKHYGDVLDERGRRYCEHIVAAAEQIGALVEHINLYISAKESPLRMEAVDFTEVAKLIRDEFSAQLEERGISLTVPEKAITLRADRLSLIRMLRNLVDNAFKYGGDLLSAIEIGCHEDDEQYMLFVKDDGMGICHEEETDLFGMFTRSGRNGKIQGTGLGLAIVKEIARRHGGDVQVKNRARSGAVFQVFLSKKLDSSRG